MTDFSEVIGACDPEDFTVIRQDSGMVLDGVPVKKDPIEFPGSGVFVPADAKTLERLDENTRTKEVLQGFTECKLRTADVEEKVLADKLEIPSRGETYQVHEVRNWLQGSFFEVICIRLGQ